MTENPLHKQSEKAKTCHWPRRASTRDYTVICFQILWSEKQKQQAWKTTQLQIFHQKKSEVFKKIDEMSDIFLIRLILCNTHFWL